MDEYYGSTLASSDFFAHYGVKGMKWGVRKTPERTGHQRKSAFKKLINKLGVNSKKNVAKKTDRWTDYEKSSYEMTLNKRLMKDIHNVLKNNSFDNLNKSAKEHTKAYDDLNAAFAEYDKKLTKLRKGKHWDGDGTEAHWEMIKRFPGYAKLAKREDETKNKFINEVEASVKSGKFDRIRDRNKYSDYYINYGPKYGSWYQKADSRLYAVATAALQRSNQNKKSDAEGYGIFFDDFIKKYDKNGKFIMRGV